MKVTFTFSVPDEAGRPLIAEICEMADSGEFLIVGPDDVNQSGYTSEFREATMKAPIDHDSILDLAANLALAETPINV